MMLLSIFGTMLLAGAVILSVVRDGLGNSGANQVTPAYNPEGKVKLRSIKDVSGIIFGKIGNMLACSPENEEGHVAIFGGTGLGKTLAILVQTLRKWRGTAFVIDIAGDICKNVNMPNKLIYEPENQESIPYNIFAEIDETEDEDEQNELLATLAHLLMPDVRKDNSTTMFFKTEGRKMCIASLISYYHAGYDFIEICRIIVKSDWETLLADIAEQGNDTAIQFISSFIGTKGENTAGCKQALDKAVNIFAFSKKLKGNIWRPKPGEQHISPDKLEEHNVFVILDDAKLKVYAPLLHVITAQSLNYMSKRVNYTGKTILFCLDELATYGRIDLTEALRKLRKKRTRVMVLTQSMADMDLIYGWDERKVMMDNFAFTVILGSDDPNTQEPFSKKIGERTVIKFRKSTTERPITTVKQSQLIPGFEYTAHGKCFNPTLGAKTQKSPETVNANEYLEAAFSELSSILVCEKQYGLSPQNQKKIPTHRTIGSWPMVPMNRFAGQSTEQIEMFAALKAKYDDVYALSDVILSDKIFEVRFWDNTVYWKNPMNEQLHTSYYLKDFAAKVTYVGEDGGHCVYSNSIAPMFMSATAVFGTDIVTNKLQGLLVVNNGYGDCVFALEEFIIVSSVDNDPVYAEFDEWEKLDNKHLFFTCFNRSRELLYTGTPKADGAPGDRFHSA